MPVGYIAFRLILEFGAYSFKIAKAGKESTWTVLYVLRCRLAHT